MRSLLLLAWLVAASAASAESGSGSVGEWDLIWRLEDGNELNRFRLEMGEEPEFPFRARLLRSTSFGRRLVLLDENGDATPVLALEPGEEILVADDASSWLSWRRDPVRRGLSTFRFFRRGEPEPEWEATAPGEPLLLAPDGSLFLLASEDSARDLYHRASLERAGRTQLVGAGGEVRAELPVQPVFAALTGDAGHVVLFVDNELLVLARDGTLAWTTPVPIDHLIARDGHEQLQAAAGRIVVAGTGVQESGSSPAWSLHPDRLGRIRVYDEAGRLRWAADQPADEPLWFQITPCLSRDGSALVTAHSEAGDIVVRAWDVETGERIWTRRESRHAGVRSLSISPDGQLITVTQGESRTRVRAWDREGNAVWEGTIPYASRTPELATGGLLVAEHWIVKLTPPDDEGA